MPYVPPDSEMAHHIKFLFKYVPVNSSDEMARLNRMLSYKSLWFWPLTRQNDPNECKPNCYFGGTTKDKVNYFQGLVEMEFPGVYTKESTRKQALKAARNPVIPLSKKSL